MLSSLLLATNCTAPEKEIVTVEVPIEREYIHPELPNKVKLNRPEWYVIQLEDNTYAAVKKEDFDKLTENNLTIGEYINKLRSIITYYRDVTGYKEQNTEN